MARTLKLTEQETQAFAAHVRRLRKDRSVEELANKANISADGWYKYERAERTPSLATAKAIARALGVRVSTLVKSID